MRKFFISFGLLIMGCNSSSSNGIAEAEADFKSSPELIACSKNIDCADHAEALFWVSAIAMSDLSATEIEVNWNALNHDERVGLIDDLVKPDYNPPDYDVSTTKFLQAYGQMKRSHELGNSYASNELGLLHFENSDLKDLDLAISYLKSAQESGDSLAPFNLTRVYLSKLKRNEALAIKSISIAASRNKDYKYHDIMLRTSLEPSFRATQEQMDFIEAKSGSIEESDWLNLFAPYIR